MTTIEAVFYGDTEETAREQYARWAAKETNADLALVSLTPDAVRGWIWHAVIEMGDSDLRANGYTIQMVRRTDGRNGFRVVEPEPVQVALFFAETA